MVEEKEIWKPIIGYEGYYDVSSFGNIRQLKKIKSNQYSSFIKKDRIICNSFLSGYLRVALFKDGIEKRFLVHRLVAENFIPNPNNKPEVNHKFGVKSDNRVSQLEWCTKLENMDHSVITGLSAQGERHPKSKLTDKDVLAIREKYNPVSYSSKKLSQEYNICLRNIQSIISRKIWKHI